MLCLILQGLSNNEMHYDVGRYRKVFPQASLLQRFLGPCIQSMQKNNLSDA